MADDNFDASDDLDYYHDDPDQEINAKPDRKKNIVIGFCASVVLILSAIFYLPSSIGGKITINTGANKELGRGVSATTACSAATNLIVTPNASFNPVSPTPVDKYFLSSIRIENIPIACSRADFNVRVYSGGLTAVQTIFGSSTGISFYFTPGGDFYTTSSASDVTVTGSSANCLSPATGTCISVILTIATPVYETNNNTKFVVTSSQGSCASGSTCSLGDIGPGGGVVFYVASTPFTSAASCKSSCLYLEAAPKTWKPGSPIDPGLQMGISAADGIYVTPTQYEIGKGFGNTQVMLGTSLARNAVWGVSIGGKTDWFIGSKYEYRELCKYASTRGTCAESLNVGNLSSTYALNSANSYNYWTSTVRSGGRFLIFTFRGYGENQGDEDAANTNSNKYIRPLRAFVNTR